jgi:DNA polymerase III sliding clamp (beta) subunit (PCNA family)
MLFTAPTKPVVLRPSIDSGDDGKVKPTDDEYTYLIMPVRLPG